MYQNVSFYQILTLTVFSFCKWFVSCNFVPSQLTILSLLKPAVWTKLFLGVLKIEVVLFFLQFKVKVKLEKTWIISISYSYADILKIVARLCDLSGTSSLHTPHLRCQLCYLNNMNFLSLIFLVVFFLSISGVCSHCGHCDHIVGPVNCQFLLILGTFLVGWNDVMASSNSFSFRHRRRRRHCNINK